MARIKWSNRRIDQEIRTLNASAVYRAARGDRGLARQYYAEARRVERERETIRRQRRWA